MSIVCVIMQSTTEELPQLTVGIAYACLFLLETKAEGGNLPEPARGNEFYEEIVMTGQWITTCREKVWSLMRSVAQVH